MNQAYYYIRNASGIITGPFSASRLQKMERDGRLGPQDMISTDQKNWQPAAVIQEAFAAPPQPQCPLPPQSQAPPTTPLPPQPTPTPPTPPRGIPYVELIVHDQDSAHPANVPAANSLWYMILADLWICPHFFEELSTYAKKMIFFSFAYSLPLAIGGWLILPPEPTLFGSSLLRGGLIGLVLWIVNLALAWFSILLANWFSSRKCHADPATIVTISSTLSRYATATGTLGLFHHFFNLSHLLNILPLTLLLLLFVWNEICQWRLLQKYVLNHLQNNRKEWIIGQILICILLFSAIFASLYYSGVLP